jgi:heptosyltransferase-2
VSNQPQKILVIGPAWVGDMVMAQTLFKLIKQHNPEAVIDVLAPEWSRALLDCMPEVTQVFASPFRAGQLHLRQRYQLAQQIKTHGYQQAIVLPNSFKSALIPFFAKIPQRTGWLGEMRFGLVNDSRFLDKKALPLMIQRFAALGVAAQEALPKKLPWPELQVDPIKVQATLQKFNLLTNRQVLVFCPGAEYGPAKRWPATYFAEVANKKLAEGWDIWILGSAKETVIAQEIQQHTAQRCIDFTGKTTLAEAVQLLASCHQVLSNDSGLMHVAAALQKPLVVMYGSSSPQFTPPLSQHVKILTLNLPCSPCFKRVCPLEHFKCMNDLKPDRVLAVLT